MDISRKSKQDKQAEFDGIVSEYEGLLLRYAARIVRDRDTAQDVVQDTFLRLFRHWKNPLSPSSQMLSWLYRVAHNCAVDHVRRQTRREILHSRHAEGEPEALPPDRGESFRISEEAEEAARALSTLSLREQQLVILKVYEEKSYKEIAEIAGVTVSNVGYILHFAMKKLAAELKRAKALPAAPDRQGRDDEV
jgi:RNA polymerase sigma-70 factor, ECF subfamily